MPPNFESAFIFLEIAEGRQDPEVGMAGMRAAAAAAAARGLSFAIFALAAACMHYYFKVWCTVAAY